MFRLLIGTTALAIITLPASAQTTAPSGGSQVTAPSGGQNSGAGIPGKPGSKSGPAVKPSGETTGSDMSDKTRPKFLGNRETRVARQLGHPPKRSSRET